MIPTGARVRVINLKDYIIPSGRDYPDVFLGEKGYIHCTNGSSVCIEFDDADLDMLNNFNWHEKNVRVITQ